MTHLGARAMGIANIAMDGSILDAWYPSPSLVPTDEITTDPGTHRVPGHQMSAKMLSLIKLDGDRRVEQVAVSTTIKDLSAPPIDAYDVYLRLHLLSHRLVKPGEINLSNAMALMNTVVWTNKGPATADNFEFVRASLRSRGLIHVYGIDKLPRMVDYVVPSGIQIAEADRVRLGAHLAPGTTVVREGYISYNSGTLGACRVEGRLTSGVTLGADCTIGLSSTIQANYVPDGSNNRIAISVGNGCVFGVAAGLVGFSIGDNCTIAANVILEPDSPVYDLERKEEFLAKELENRSNWSASYVSGVAVPVINFH